LVVEFVSGGIGTELSSGTVPLSACVARRDDCVGGAAGVAGVCAKDVKAEVITSHTTSRWAGTIKESYLGERFPARQRNFAAMLVLSDALL
jgi:hypothetical protein